MRIFKIIDGYIIKKYLSTFVFTLLILSVISCVIDYSQKVDDFVEGHAPTTTIIMYFVTFVPWILALLFPLFVLLSTIFVVSKMAERTEVIAILASGTSFTRFLRPFIIGSLILASISFIANNVIVPVSSHTMNKIQEKYIWSKKVNQPVFHIRVSPKDYITIGNFSFYDNTGNNFVVETFDSTVLTQKIMADNGYYDSTHKQWILHNAVVRTNDGLKESLKKYPELKKKYAFSPYDININDEAKSGMTTTALNKYIEAQKLRGAENVNNFILEKYRRSAQPVSTIILTVIGTCIASRKVRGGSGLHLALGIILSALYIMFIQISNTFSINAGFSPLIATWIPNFIFGLVALYLYLKRIWG